MVLMPFGTDYGVSEAAWHQIKTHPSHRVICQTKDGEVQTVVSASLFAAITPSGVIQSRGRTLYMLPRTEVERQEIV